MKSYKNSSSKNYRVEANKRTVSLALSGNLTNTIYAKVLAKMGDARMRIYYEEDKRNYEGIGKIRGLLRKRGQVPIQVNDVVIVSPREFESSGINSKKNFDIIAVLSSKEANELKKRKEIPDYYLNDFNSNNLENIEFDYSGKEFNESKDSDNEDKTSDSATLKDNTISIKELNEIIDNI
jgi:translation initiation factor IF-1